MSILQQKVCGIDRFGIVALTAELRRDMLSSGEVQVLATPDYDSAVEDWEFPPGTKVRCENEIKGGRELLVARQRIG